MDIFIALLYMCFLVGLGVVAPLATVKSPVVRQVLLALGLLLVNLGALIILGAGYLVSRLEGSIPPTVVQFLAPLWLPTLLILLADFAMVAVFRSRAKTGAGLKS